MKRAINLIVATAAVFAGPAVLAPPASAATPTCNTVISVSNSGPDVKVPAYSGTGSTNCSLQQGNYNNAAVRELQSAMNRCYFVYHVRPPNKLWPIDVDSDFGEETGRALREVQAFHTDVPADIDGEYGPITRELMDWRTVFGNGCWTLD